MGFASSLVEALIRILSDSHGLITRKSSMHAKLSEDDMIWLWSGLGTANDWLHLICFILGFYDMIIVTYNGWIKFRVMVYSTNITDRKIFSNCGSPEWIHGPRNGSGSGMRGLMCQQARGTRTWPSLVTVRLTCMPIQRSEIMCLGMLLHQSLGVHHLCWQHTV